MSYRLKVKEPLAEGIQRIALEQLEIAESELRGNADANAAVHNARRALKRLRALLRLVRTGLDDSLYRRESLRFAEIGRTLAGQRDRHVMQQTLKRLGGETTAFAHGLAAAIAHPAAEPTAHRDSAQSTREKAASRLSAARKAFTGENLGQLEVKHLLEGIAKVYKKARRLNRQCHEGAGTGEDFHALRKAVQQHWRHMQLLSRAWPEALTARAAEAKALSQLLGDDHDLHVLASFAEANAEALSSDELDDLRRKAGEAQAALRERQRLHGARLFAEPADNLVERLRTYWASSQGLAEIEAAAEDDDPAPAARKTRIRTGGAVRPRRAAKSGTARRVARRKP